MTRNNTIRIVSLHLKQTKNHGKNHSTEIQGTTIKSGDYEMTEKQKQALQLFNDKKVRTAWDAENEKWYFSIIDVCGVLTDQPDTEHARNYWKVLKNRLSSEGNETVTKCNQLKLLASDGKMRLTDVADQEQLFRLIQSIPSPKAEPFKVWIAKVASQRLDEMQDPELSISRAMDDYRRLGYPEEWIEQRCKSFSTRNDLTSEWKRCGIEGQQYASLTDIITKEWSGMRTKDYKQFKGLHKENLRDNMTKIEYALNNLAEVSTTEISKAKNPTTYKESADIAKSGGEIAKTAKDKLEQQLGRSVISPQNAKALSAEKPQKSLK